MTARTRCFFDISIDRESAGRIIFELYDNKVPKTCNNFKHLCLGDKGIGKTSGKLLSYKGCPFHRNIKGFMIQGGDFSAQNGTGGESIYGEKFEDENLEGKHDGPGLLSMANAGPNTNGSQFFITTAAASHLDGKHVVFGKVVKGMDLVREMEQVPTAAQDVPKVPVVITNCGVILPGQDDGIPVDVTGDQYPDFPDDYHQKTLEVPVLLDIAKELKGYGNDLYKKTNYKLAFRKYDKAIRYLKKKERWELKDNEKDLIQEALIPLHLNKAACALKLARYDDAYKATTYVLEEVTNMDISPADRIKALFRRGQARVALNDFDRAIDDFKKAEKLDPEDQAIKTELLKAAQKSKEFIDKEKKFYSRMFAQ